MNKLSFLEILPTFSVYTFPWEFLCVTQVRCNLETNQQNNSNQTCDMGIKGTQTNQRNRTGSPEMHTYEPSIFIKYVKISEEWKDSVFSKQMMSQLNIHTER